MANRRRQMEMMHEMSEEAVQRYGTFLALEERSRATIEKYMRDIRSFLAFLPEGGAVDKEAVIRYKQTLEEKFKLTSANSMLAALNGFFAYMGWADCRVRQFKSQKKLLCRPERELNKAEYLRLLEAAKGEGNERLYLLMQTICGTGIRVSELKFITVEAVKCGRASVRNKGKERVIFLTGKLRRVLGDYCRRKKRTSGSVFVTRTQKPMNRSNIWAEMKRLCRNAKVDPEKVFPHNLRHLFARTYYRLQRDVMNLADILGHSSVETTRIYTAVSGREWEQRLSRLGLVP